MAGLAYPGKSSIHRELAAIDAFINALGDSNMRMRVRDKKPKSLDHALHIALLAEANTKAKPAIVLKDSQPRANNYKARVVQNAHKPAGNAQIASVDSINDRCDKICKMLENIYKDKTPASVSTARTDAMATSASVEREYNLLQMQKPGTLRYLLPRVDLRQQEWQCKRANEMLLLSRIWTHGAKLS